LTAAELLATSVDRPTRQMANEMMLVTLKIVARELVGRGCSWMGG